LTDRPTGAELRHGAVAQAIRRHRLIVVLRRIEPREELLKLVDELADAGARVFEVTFDADSAADDLVALRRRLEDRSDGPFVVGAGTLLAAAQLRAACEAGADFGVSPVLDLELMRAAVDDGLPFVPGGMTPTEICAAWSAGATFVKLFPASAVGPQLIREMRGPFPDIAIVPTGGVDADNARDFIAAGAAAVGIGSAIVRADPAGRRVLVMALAQQ
jgi:2-dehydro-3-deoxyphosphogluconate aldolase/(4S)-4-hydroxy-2-oxoglutarate aldolase